MLMRIRIRGSASEKTDPDPRIRIEKNRSGTSFWVKDFCEFYFPSNVFPSLDFHFFKEVIILYYKSLKKNIFCSLYFGCPLCYPDPFRIRFVRHDADPDPAK